MIMGIYDELDDNEYRWLSQWVPWVRIIAANRQINTIVPMSSAINKINRPFSNVAIIILRSPIRRVMYEKWLSHNLHNSLVSSACPSNHCLCGRKNKGFWILILINCYGLPTTVTKDGYFRVTSTLMSNHFSSFIENTHHECNKNWIYVYALPDQENGRNI